MEWTSVHGGAKIDYVWSRDRSYMFSPLNLSEADDVALQMVSLPYLQAEIDKLKIQEKYAQVLELGQFTREEIEQNRMQAQQKQKGKRIEPPKKVIDFKNVSEKVLEKKPQERKNIFKSGEQAAQVYGLSSLLDLCKLQEYLEVNRGFQLKYVPKDGTCMWQAVVECLNTPLEYQYQMLKRQVVLTMTEHPEFFFNLLDDHIKGQYGPKWLPAEEYKRKLKEGTLTRAQKEDQFVPGPFSFCSYLEYILKDSSWGDQGTLLVISFMWQLKITVITAKNLHQERIWHNSSM